MAILEIYTRVFVEKDALQSTESFYIAVFKGEKTMEFHYPEVNLDIVAISSPNMSFLIIAGSTEARARFEETRLTVRVDSTEDYQDPLRGSGAEQMEAIQETPVGHKMRFKHPDGMVVEYVDWNKKTGH